jgi:MFS family permease
MDTAGAYAATAGGMMNTGFGVAGMISPLAFGFLIEKTGSYQVPFLASAGLLAVGIVAALFIDPTRKVDDPASSTASIDRDLNLPHEVPHGTATSKSIG